MKDLLKIKNFSLTLSNKKKRIQILKEISITLEENSIIGIVGQSGSGKSMLAKSILQLIPERENKHTQGSIFFKGNRIDSTGKKQIKALRGKEIAMIFQNPMSCLNPTMKIITQVEEIVFTHFPLYPKSLLRKQVLEVFESVGINNPKERFSQYPHQLSGGMLQRVMIAMMMLLKPQLLIADEPTTALDATVQAQILNVLKHLQKTTRMSMLFITHDLLLAHWLCNKIYVMKEGSIVEEGDTNTVFNHPKQEYTKKLIDALPPYDFMSEHKPFQPPTFESEKSKEIIGSGV